MKTDVEIVPYGEVFSALSKQRWRTIGRHTRISKSLERTPRPHRRVFVTFSCDLDESFAALFREKATRDTRLVILNEGGSTDKLLSRIFDLQIRTPQRCYVVEGKFGSGKTHFAAALLHSFLDRLVLGLETDEKQKRILDARVENGILHVVTPNFDRLDVPMAEVPDFKNADSVRLEKFEIDEDGAFIYWPELDVHLGWTQLQQLVNPEAALKASQKSEEFNKRYGKAVQRLREEAGFNRSDVPRLSEKQLGRIERGECRLTSNAIEMLSKAHKLAPTEYMKKLAETLD
jgi:uncharacterized protein DUF2442